MPRHCSAGGCKSRDNRETRNAGITFHKLPKGAIRRNLWITNSHRPDSWDPQTDFVYFCSKHFTPESFELTGCSGIRRLKEDAFPTVFASSSTTKCKRTGALQKKGDIPVRKNPHNMDNTQLETDMGETCPSDEPTVRRSVAAPEGTNENTLAFSREPVGVEQLSRQECSPSPPPAPRSLSPSRYMKRLPRPPGFYLSREHSYAQLCPLLWRRRYDQAIDCLEKALRQLHAARRRENRLRSTVLRLRDKRLKQALLVSQEGCKTRGGWTTGEKRGGRGKKSCTLEEGEADAKSEDMQEAFEDRCVNQTEFRGCFLPDTNNWSKGEQGYCFFCGKGQAQAGGQGARRVSKTGKDIQSTAHEDSLKISSVETRTCSTAQTAKDIQIVQLERLSGKSAETSESNVTNCGLLHQAQGFQRVIPAGVSLVDIHEQSLQLYGSQQKLLHPDKSERETGARGQEHHLDLQQLYWIQDGTEGQVLLLPVPAEDRSQSILKMEEVADEAQATLESEAGPKGDLGHLSENSRGLSRVETTCDGEHSVQHSVINVTSLEVKEDVRKKLKEHLEGFHLQLSTEFLN